MSRIVRCLSVVTCCLIAFNTTLAQFTVSEQKDTSKAGTVYTFPVFSSTNPDNPHESVNHWLQSNELELEIGDQDSSIFEKIWPTFDQPYSGTTEFGYHVITNSRKILSVEFNKEGCGAYCENFTTYYNFDASTGQFLELAQLFTEDGLKQLAKSITNERVAAVNAAIKKATTEGEEDTKSMYEGCMEYLTDPEGFNGGFYIEKTKIHILHERCSNHALRALDEVGDFDNVRSFAQLHPYLSDYGKKLLY
jgi:hypothetical protein